MGWLRRDNWNRPRVIFALSIVLAGTAAGVIWGRIASRNRLSPIIAYHAAQYAINRNRWVNDLDQARGSMNDVRLHFDHLSRWSGQVSENSAHSRANRASDEREGKSATNSLDQALESVKKPIQDATMHENMAIYHAHMKMYYEDLLQHQVLWLPAVPTKLDIERKMIELALRRSYGDKPREDSEEAELLWKYLAEPPPRLDPRGR